MNQNALEEDEDAPYKREESHLSLQSLVGHRQRRSKVSRLLVHGKVTEQYFSDLLVIPLFDSPQLLRIRNWVRKFSFLLLLRTL